MEKFPKLTDQQVALLRVDINTGHVLNDEIELAIRDDQKIHTTFDYVEKALMYARTLILQQETIECVIYSVENKILYQLEYGNVRL